MIDILMATYNGEKFIAEQLDSILNQSFKDWHLYINDDNSNDSTPDIITFYKDKYPDKITLSLSECNRGAKGNFFELMKKSKNAYIMFCDQDDVWERDKIQKTLDVMKACEGNLPHIPVLVHTDLEVTDEDLNVVNPSYFKLSRIKNETALNRAIVQNCVTGCSVMINKALLDLAGEDDENIIMHDWWLYLIASAFGKIGFLNEGTIKYRQHSKNEVGAKGLKYRKKADLKNSLDKTYSQAHAFYKAFENRLTESQQNLLKEYISIKDYGKIRKIRTILKHGFFKHSMLRRIVHLFVC